MQTQIASATAPLVLSDEQLQSLLKWARSVARGIRQHYGFLAGSQEEQDIQSVAYLTFLRILPAFNRERVPDGGDPLGQLRGWAHPHIRGECRREAIRLRNGGTYRTRDERRHPRIQVEALPVSRGECEEVVIEDYRDQGAEIDPPEQPWTPYVTD